MNLKPLFDRVIIKPEIKENISNSGLVLPETSQERPQEGIVVAVGEGVDFDGNEIGIKVKIGQRVVFNRYSGVELKLNNETYLILRQIDIVGVFDD